MIKSLTLYLRRHPALLVGLLASLMFLPWLGLPLFNTKGEPREAIVAVSMLQSGDWVLPVSFGGDIPYKPPFLAWCIALLSWLAGGVSEYTSRLPSALAAIALAVATQRWARRGGASAAASAVTAILTVTCFEVWRAASACRVDMVLTFFMASATMALNRYIDGPMRRIPWGAVALMTCAVLTKGPVGMLLPCLVAGVAGLVARRPFWPLFRSLALTGLLVLVVPALWYVAAWRSGGDEFLRLAMEENFGRMTGTMSYDSHVQPFWYPLLTILWGWVPYTLLALMALTAVSWRRPSLGSFSPSTLLTRLRALPPLTLYSAVAAAVIVIFFCIPKSKRSVYLLPAYPFIGYLMMLLVERMRREAPMRWFVATVSSLAILLPAAVWISAMLPGSVAASMSPSASIQFSAIASAALSINGVWALPLCLVTGLWGWSELRRGAPRRLPAAMIATVTAILLSLSSAILPPVLSAKSDKPLAEAVCATAPDGPVYEFHTDPLIRYYTVNFYIGDRMRLFAREMPTNGWIIIDEPDIEAWREAYGDAYTLTEVTPWHRRSCDTRRQPHLMRFARRQAATL